MNDQDESLGNSLPLEVDSSQSTGISIPAPNTPNTENTQPQQDAIVTNLRGLSVRAEFSSSPLPAPSLLKAYDLILPGLAERIIAQVELQAQHRMQLEKTVVESDTKRADLGLILGFIVGLACISGAALVVMNGHDIAGASFVGFATASIVGTFVYGSNSRKNERIEKQKGLPSVQPENE